MVQNPAHSVKIETEYRAVVSGHTGLKLTFLSLVVSAVHNADDIIAIINMLAWQLNKISHNRAERC